MDGDRMTRRSWNIGLRTAHIAAMGVLLGGHAFDTAPERLLTALCLTIGTGIALTLVEAGPHLLWFHQGRGILTLAKMGFLFTVPLLWDYRLAILLLVVALGSVGSHMPARYRYYSVVQRAVIPDHTGPRGRWAGREEDGEAQ
jgi:hypothetical protein